MAFAGITELIDKLNNGVHSRVEADGCFGRSDIVINGTPVEEAAQAAEDQLNELFETVG